MAPRKSRGEERSSEEEEGAAGSWAEGLAKGWMLFPRCRGLHFISQPTPPPPPIMKRYPVSIFLSESDIDFYPSLLFLASHSIKPCHSVGSEYQPSLSCKSFYVGTGTDMSHGPVCRSFSQECLRTRAAVPNVRVARVKRRKAKR
jgi:hypothetical protein